VHCQARATLVIHPRDPSTDFLKALYVRTLNCTVVSSGATEMQIRAQIAAHDRVLFLGHGCAAGLVDSTGAFGAVPAVLIGDSYGPLISEQKKDAVFIWCMADEFVAKHRLSGFCTGMFVSEATEAAQCGIAATQEQIESSNELFVACVAACINDGDAALVHKNVRDGPYGELARTNPVAAYNHKRLFLFP
jgi:hypothetical protein